MLLPEASSQGSQETIGSSWRDEVASRVNSYRVKRGRRLEGDFSMRFNFEPLPMVDTPLVHAGSPVAVAEPEEEIVEAEVAIAADPEPAINVAAPVSEPAAAHQNIVIPTSPLDPPAPNWGALAERARVAMQNAANNLIQFPRLSTLLPPANELADPVLDKPRILDVPEQVAPMFPTIIGPLFAKVDLSEHRVEPQPVRPADQLDLPLQVAPVRQRVVAAAVDCAVVLCCSLVLAIAARQFVGSVPLTKSTVGILILFPFVLWAMYEYVFLVYGGTTIGMETARVALSTYDGRFPSAGLRKQRALATVLSLASVALGFAWAFFDYDTLCWHDRISRTFLTNQVK